MNRREMLKTVVGGTVAACVGVPIMASEPRHIGVDLATAPSITTFAIALGDTVPLIITHGADDVWRASRDGLEWQIEEGVTTWLHLKGRNGDCKMRVVGDNIIEIEWLRFWDSPEKLAAKYDLPELLEIVV